MSMTVHCPKCNRLLEICNSIDDEAETLAEQRLITVTCPDCGTVSTQKDLEPTAIYSKTPDLRQKQVGHFTLIRTLGQGSAGEVWLAEDINLSRQVALKLPRSPDQETMSLLFEAKTAASLRHPHIVSVHEVGTEGDQVFIASEYIDGLTLRDFLTQGKPPVARTVELLTQIARALHYAHQQGIVHRDVKPANILLNRQGQPYVADFGLAKHLDADATLSGEGQVVGTAKYMSPEQASGRTRETDARSDLYALGVIMFEMLTGDVPFRGNARAILDQKVNQDPPSPRILYPSLPKDLETICLKCLEREPGKRYATSEEFAEELGRFAAGEPIRARPISRVERSWRWCRRRPVLSGLVASLFLSLTFGLLAVTMAWRESVRSADAARQSLYRSQMNLAAVHLSHGDISGVHDMLQRTEADPGMASLRGFEWNYYDRLIAPLEPVANHGDMVTDVALSRDGNVCASIGEDKQIRVWDVRTGELIRTLKVDNDVTFRSIEFSPISMHLASGSSDGFVRVWTPLENDRVLRQMQHGPKVILIRYSPNGKRLLATAATGAVRIWDAESGAVTAEIPTGKRTPTRDVRFSADGKKITVASKEGHLRVWNIEGYKLGNSPEAELDSTPELEAVALSEHGELLATGDYHGQLMLHTPGKGEPHRHASVWGRIDDMEFVPGMPLLMVVSSDGQLHLFDTNRKEEIRSTFTHGLTLGSLALAANGKSLVIGSGDGSVIRVQLESLTTPNILWHEKAVRDVAFLPGGNEVVAVDEAGTLQAWNLQTCTSTPFATAPVHDCRVFSLQPGGSLLASAGRESVVVLWDVKSRTVVQELAVPATGTANVRFSPLGKRLAIVTRDGPVLIYDTTQWDKPRTQVTPASAVAALTFSLDDERLAMAREGRIVEIYDANSGVVQDTIPLKSEPMALQYCDEGRLLAIGTSIGEIHLWDVSSNKTRTVIKGHTGQVHCLARLPGQSALVSGGRDRHLKLWEIASGELITHLPGHSRRVFCLAVSPDGGTIASGGLEGDVRIWVGK